MREGEGFLLVYSITDRDSFDMISVMHQQLLRVKDTESVPLVLVGNKCDLEPERRVDVHEGRHIARELGCHFVETSAKLGTNVGETFLNLVRQIRDRNKVRPFSSLSPVLFSFFGGGWEGGMAVPMTLIFLRPAPHQELLQMRRIPRAVTPDDAIRLPGAGCWNSSSCVIF